MRRHPLTVPIAMLLIGAGGGGYFADDLAASAARLVSSASPTSCHIKGNVSIETGERIYHVPGQKFYDETKISPHYGERWFCSEAEARAAGWRRAKR